MEFFIRNNKLTLHKMYNREKHIHFENIIYNRIYCRFNDTDCKVSTSEGCIFIYEVLPMTWLHFRFYNTDWKLSTVEGCILITEVLPMTCCRIDSTTLNVRYLQSKDVY